MILRHRIGELAGQLRLHRPVFGMVQIRVIVVDAGEDPTDLFSAEPSRQRRDVEVVAHLIPFDNQISLDANDLFQRGHGHPASRRQDDALSFERTPTDELANTCLYPAELSEDDLAGHRTIQHEVAVTLQCIENEVETISKIRQNMIVISRHPMVRIERSSRTTDQHSFRNQVLQSRRGVQDFRQPGRQSVDLGLSALILSHV